MTADYFFIFGVERVCVGFPIELSSHNYLIKHVIMGFINENDIAVACLQGQQHISHGGIKDSLQRRGEWLQKEI